VVAPDRGLTLGAAIDVVRTVLARHRHGYRLTAEQLDRLSLNDRVEYERAARQPLAVVAMTAVDEHWLVEELVADGSAGAATVDFLCHGERFERGGRFFSSALRRTPTSGEASKAIRVRPPGPRRPDDEQCPDSWGSRTFGRSGRCSPSDPSLSRGECRNSRTGGDTTGHSGWPYSRPGC